MNVHVHCLTLLCLVLLLLQTPPSNGQRSESGSRNRTSLRTSVTEKDALLAFKRSVEDPRSVLQDWRNRTDPCADQWPGIQCSNNATIIEINFPGFELKGELPTFEELPHLMRIILPNNSFEGPLPEAWQRLSYLQRVDLSGNKISGTLPDSWSELSQLEALNLNNNEIAGELPGEWWLLDIEVLALAKNQLEGTLPSNWGNMDNIQILDLTENKLNGNLPKSWASLDTLRMLFLSGNSLFGSLPGSWSGLSTIEDLRLENNNFVGELPQNWRFLLSANTIFLSGNNLGGFIPEDWSGISKTCRIDLSNNPYICNLPPSGSVIARGGRDPGFVLTGTNQGTCPSESAKDTQALLQFKAELTIPTENDPLESWNWKGESACEDQWTGIQCQNGRIVKLDLSAFGLSGALSDKLSQLESLEDLKLQNNQFHDPLPIAWNQFGSLKHLNVSNNTIGGQLPSEWSALSQLEVLDVSQNELLGTLPPQWNELTNLKTLKGGQNNINGPLPFSWSSMESLEILQIQENIITGALPMTWGALSELNELDLSQNQLLGPVPPQWSTLEKLRVLKLDKNEQLCGGIPASLPQPSASIQRNLSSPCPIHIQEAILLIELKSEVLDPQQYLNLWKAGSPPCQSETGRWPGVQCNVDRRVIGLNLDGFQLQGKLPVSSITKIQNLEHLQLSRNEFEGPLPPVWGQMDNLKTLNLSSNALTGALPPEWGQMESLEVLDLSNNDLEGSMPTEWSGMGKLQSLGVSGLTRVCDGLPNHLDSNRIDLRSENSTFLESCDSDGDSSDFSVISILLSVFIVITVVVWVSCFCCCCLERKKQRRKLLEMVSSGVLRSRQRSEKDSPVGPLRIQADGPALFEDRPGTSTQTAPNGQSRDSIYNRSRSGIVLNYNASRTAQPSSSNQRINESVFFPPVLYPLHPLPHRFHDHCAHHYGHTLHPECSRMTHLNQSPNQELRSQSQDQLSPGRSRRRIGFGSIQSTGPSNSRGELQGRNSDDQASTRQHRTAFEVFREPQRPSPTSTQEGTVLATPLRANSENHEIDPRSVRSRIPRLVHSSAVPASTNEAPTSAYQAFVDNSLHSTEKQEQNDGSTQFSSSPLSDRYLDRNPEGVAQDEGPSELHSQMVNDSWNLETTVEIPNEARKETSSMSAEMFRWLESCQQSGTFDLEDLSRELFTRQQQGPPATNTHPNFTPAAQRFSNLNVANIAMDGIQSSTKDLLFWLESRIDEVKRAPADQFGRNKNVRSSRFPGDSNLFNYKTSSTMTDG